MHAIASHGLYVISALPPAARTLPPLRFLHPTLMTPLRKALTVRNILVRLKGVSHAVESESDAGPEEGKAREEQGNRWRQPQQGGTSLF